MQNHLFSIIVYVFPIVWPILYTMMGVAYALVTRLNLLVAF
ncbi:tryptophan-rich sensory protein [Staphylococcus warneri]